MFFFPSVDVIMKYKLFNYDHTTLFANKIKDM